MTQVLPAGVSYASKSKVFPSFGKRNAPANRPQVNGNALTWPDVGITAHGKRKRTFAALFRVDQPPVGVSLITLISYLAETGTATPACPQFSNNVTLALMWA